MKKIVIVDCGSLQSAVYIETMYKEAGAKYAPSQEGKHIVSWQIDLGDEDGLRAELENEKATETIEGFEIVEMPKLKTFVNATATTAR